LKHLVEGFKLRQPGEEGLDLWLNLPYQIAMARVHYFRVKQRLPKHTNVEAMASYWKKYYNTPKGAGEKYEAQKAYWTYCTQ
jgi:hypothetical protein